jgi:CRP-like cAMP-binding protein
LQVLFERILLLKRVPFFELLRTDQLRHVALILEPVGWVAGEQVFHLGEPGGQMYIIVQGRVGIAIHEDPGCRDFVAEMKSGDCFGEMGVLDGLPRSATAHVLEDTEALSLSKERLHGLLMSYPELGVGMLLALSRRLRQANIALAGHQNGAGAMEKPTSPPRVP